MTPAPELFPDSCLSGSDRASLDPRRPYPTEIPERPVAGNGMVSGMRVYFERPREIDFAHAPDASTLLPALGTHGMVVLRGWTGTEGDLVALGRAFGELERPSATKGGSIPELFIVSAAADGGAARTGCYWHADGFAHASAPALLTLYHVAQGAASSDGTAFVDGHAAWQSLSDALRRRLDGRWWTHASGSRHPFVRRHHLYDVPVLSVNLGRMIGVDGVDNAELVAIVAAVRSDLDQLRAYVHAWRNEDLLIVDNHRFLHHAPRAISGDRILWRVSVRAPTMSTE